MNGQKGPCQQNGAKACTTTDRDLTLSGFLHVCLQTMASVMAILLDVRGNFIWWVG